MLTNPTYDRMLQLGLRGMASAYCDLQEQSRELASDDWLALLLEREASVRADKRLVNRLRTAIL